VREVKCSVLFNQSLISLYSAERKNWKKQHIFEDWGIYSQEFIRKHLRWSWSFP